MMDNTFRPKEIVRDMQPIMLPDGVSHGTYKAAMRTDCTCDECRAKRAKIRSRNLRGRR